MESNRFTWSVEQDGPRYHWKGDGSGRIEWDSLEQLAQVNLGLALQMAQLVKQPATTDADGTAG